MRARPTGRYDEVAQASAAVVIECYSTSFGWATRLLAEPVRTHVRCIYALVRVADELVDDVDLAGDVGQPAVAGFSVDVFAPQVHRKDLHAEAVANHQ